MGTLTNTTSEKLLKLLVGQSSFFGESVKLDIYLGLFTTKPTQSSSGQEVTGGNYSRQSIPSGAWTYDSASNRMENNALISFNAASASWGTIRAVGLFDNSAGGNLLWYTYLSTPISINTNETLALSASTLFLEFLQPTLVNEAFDDDVSSGYTLTSASGVTAIKTFDPAIGYKDTGSLQLALTVNTASGTTTTALVRNAAVPVSPDSKYSLFATCLTSNTALIPKLTFTFYTSGGSTTDGNQPVVETVTSVLADRWQTRTLTEITAPATAATVKVGLQISTAAGATGTVWIDNLRVVKVD